MKWSLGAALVFLLVVGAKCQENAVKNLSPSLLECYSVDLYKTWNQLPHNMETLIALLRKIEEHSGQNADLLNMRYLSTAILHRFRQDGIVNNPKVQQRDGVLPYAPLGKQFYRHAQTLRVIPGNAFNFPNDSLSAVERCTLHSMLSSSINIFERGDEGRVCKFANYGFRRFGRSVPETEHEDFKEDVETLSPEQIEMMSHSETGPDPSLQYPPLPPNHPSIAARLVNSLPLSKCPTENGVVSTPWGTVSGGALIAGIAAGFEPQLIRIDDLIKQQVEIRVSGYATDTMLDNKFLATLAGDLAEVALKQGPHQTGSGRYTLGAEGSWNSTSRPLYYFLAANENLEMTGAEIRGDLDGLILAAKVPGYQERARSLRLSQVLDMYYNERGLFERRVRACKRREHLLEVAPTDALTAQTFSAAILLSPEIASATFSSDAVERFVKQAVEDLGMHIPTMNRDEDCDGRSESQSAISEPAVDLTIILDTTWPFDSINKILSQLLASPRLHFNKYNSNFTIMSGQDGSFIINSTYSILALHSFNSTVYERLARGLDLPRSLERLRRLQTEKLNREQRLSWAGGKSDVVLVIPYQSTISQSDKEYCNETLKRMTEEVPDANVLFLTYGSKDRWSELVLNPDTDIISISIGESTEHYPALDTLTSRIKQVARRLVNTQCGASYEQIGSSRPLTDYVPPGGVNFYRMHANYFFSGGGDNPPRIKIQSMDSNPLRVCSSREPLHENATEALAAAICAPVMQGRSHTLTLDCDGADYIHECKPFYLSVAANTTGTPSFSCNDPRECRYPDNVRFQISFENLECKSGQSALLMSPLILLLAFARFVF